jgi:hypothetical protein
MNVNDLMNMNDMYYVGNIIDTDGKDWVTKSEAQSILDELMGSDDNSGGYGDESADEHRRMWDSVGVKI